jgi:hypothetical protein
VAKVLSLRDATAVELSQLTGLQPRTVYRVLVDLQANGMAARADKADGGTTHGAARARRWRFLTEANHDG